MSGRRWLSRDPVALTVAGEAEAALTRILEVDLDARVREFSSTSVT